MAAMAVVWRQLTAWNMVLFPVQMWFCLGVLMQLSVEAQSTCESSMCERPPSTIKSSSHAQRNCHAESSKILVLCNVGFRQQGENYTAQCTAGGVWVPDNGCVLDIFAVVIASSAALVAILVFALFITVVCSCRSKKRKRHSLSKIQGKPKKKGKKKGAADVEAANGQTITNGQGFANSAYTNNTDDDFIDDFSDDEDETVPNKQPIQESIYQNHAVIM